MNTRAVVAAAWLALAAAGPAPGPAQAGSPPARSPTARDAVAPAQGPGAQLPAPQSGDTALEARTRAVASQLRCPVCQGLSVEDSPTDLARDMRAVVRDQLASGRSPEEVKAYFVAKYGEWILLEPEPHGLNLAVYLLPLLALLAGTGVIVRSVRQWTNRGAPGGGGEP